METKYILHGGFKEGVKQINDDFFTEVLKDTPQKVKVLIVYFATDNGDKYFSEDIEQFEKNGLEKKIEFQKANEKKLEKQISWADVIYLRGGSSLKILEKMKGFPDFEKWIVGKVVAGDSAGANLLSTVFYSKRNGICKGLGILPIKLIPHFKEENRNKLNVEADLKTVTLKEYEFTTFKDCP